MAMPIQELQRVQTSLSIIDNVNLQQIQATMQKIAQFQAVVQKTLRQGHDYGVIPGTGNKPTLLKPGAEKILMLMGLTSEYEVTEKIQDYEKGFFAFTVCCKLSRNGMVITQGLGHANTKEARYDRRWVTEKNLPEGVDKSSLKKREKNGKYGKYEEYLIENDDPFTLVNTVLKMAKKRAQVDAALTVASLSDIFSQDLEDLDISFDDDLSQKPAQDTSTSQRKTNQRKNNSTMTDNQMKKLYAMSKELGIEKESMVYIMMERYGKDSSKDLTKQEASDLIEYLTKIENGEVTWILDGEPEAEYDVREPGED